MLVRDPGLQMGLGGVADQGSSRVASYLARIRRP
jgi:hypothetical protein